jgi:hypothetical protein
MYRIPMVLAFLTPVALFSQSTSTTPTSATPHLEQTISDSTLTTSPHEIDAPERGTLSYVDFGGSSNRSGHILTIGFSLGYQFNEHVTVDANVPFYFVSATDTITTATAGTPSTTVTDHGIGDPSFSLLLRFPNRIVDYKTRITTWVPVAEMSSGFSTGSVLVDWTSHFSRAAGRLLPFGQIDIANTVPDTPLFLLPYTAQGFNARFETGSTLALTTIFRPGASFYYVLPSGQQSLYSREVLGTTTAGGGMSGGMGGHGNQGPGSGNRNGFMTQHVTEGIDLTRDHGFSTWLTANLPHFVDLQIGFTRSYGYDLNTVSFGVGFDPVQALSHLNQ